MSVLRPVARYLLTIWAASILIFVLMRAAPGNPARVALGVNATEDAVAELSQSLGLERPLISQYLDWMGGLLTGSFGISLSSQQDITPLVIDRAQVSLILVGAAMVLALAIALPAGIWLARRPNLLLSAMTQAGIALPSFLVGIVLVGIFAVRLGWLPANGWSPPNQGQFLAHLVLPVISLALVQAAMLTRYVRSAIVDIMHEDYIRTARSLGESHLQALVHHGLRNAVLPVLTITGVQLSTLIVGAVVIENVFVIPGLGSMLLDAVAVRDLTTVQTLVMLLVVFTLAINLAVDLLYRLIDPRLKEAR